MSRTALCPRCERKYTDESEFCERCGVLLVDLSDDQYYKTGQVLDDRYRVEKCLGSGGMGEVYLALHWPVERPVALKVLRQELSREEGAVKRFLREIKAVALLKSPHTVTLYDSGIMKKEKLLYFTMEYLEGESLGDLMEREGPLSAERIAEIILPVCDSLAEAHAMGIVHRDLKPENIFVARDHRGKEMVKVLDFGIAKVVSGTAERSELTAHGGFCGTPTYMSPQQCQGLPHDGRSDIYSLGIIMYEMLCGQAPFTGEDYNRLFYRHVHESPVPPSKVAPDLEVPLPLEDLILRSLAKKPEERPSQIGEVIKELQEWSPLASAGPNRVPRRAYYRHRPWYWAALALIAVAALALGAAAELELIGKWWADPAARLPPILSSLPVVASCETVEFEGALAVPPIVQPATLTVTSTPPGAFVVVDNIEAGQTPWQGSIMPGIHQILLELEGYPQTQRRVRVLPFGFANIDMPLTSTLKVESQPPGQSVLVDGKVVCSRTPCEAHVPWGRHEVALQVAGRALQQRIVEAKPGAEHEEYFSLLGKVELGCKVANCLVRIDGAQSVQAGFKELPLGPHTFEWMVDGKVYRREENVEVTADRQLTLSYDLPGQIAITSLPEGASIIVDGEVKGETKCEVLADRGKHHIRWEVDGRTICEEDILVAPATVETVHCDLRAHATVKSDPALTAEVYIDDKKVGDTPATSELPWGKHKIKVIKNGMTMCVKNVTLAPKQKWEFTCSLTGKLTVDVKDWVRVYLRPEGERKWQKHEKGYQTFTLPPGPYQVRCTGGSESDPTTKKVAIVAGETYWLEDCNPITW